MTAPTKPPANVPPSQSLIGKGSQDLVALLGTPGLVRHDKGVEVWQYARGSCVLIFYLYDDRAGGRRVTYLEAMPQGAVTASPPPAAVSPEACLGEQMRALTPQGGKKTSSAEPAHRSSYL